MYLYGKEVELMQWEMEANATTEETTDVKSEEADAEE